MTYRNPHNRFVRFAEQCGFDSFEHGSKHIKAYHPNGGWTIIPYGRKHSDSAERNIRARIKRTAMQLPRPNLYPPS